jgi:hypothetical protein
MTDEIKAHCKSVKKIVESRHLVIVPAFLSNLAAFEHSVIIERDQDADIKKLKDEVNHLKKLMSSDVNTGSGRAAGAGMQKRKT